MKNIILSLSFVVLLVIPVFGQKHEEPPPDVENPHKMIETIKLWKIIDFLDLDEEQVATFLPRLKKIEKHRRDTHKERRELLKRLWQLVEEDESDTEIKKAIKEVLTFDREMKNKEEELREDVLSVLSVKQQAKLLVFEERFEEEIRNIIKELRKNKEMGPPREKKF
jgi:hypothetical protein